MSAEQLLQQTTKLCDLTVLAGATTSQVMRSGGDVTSKTFPHPAYNLAFGLMLYSPAALAETGTIEICDKLDGSGTFRTLQDDTPADIAVPAAGKARLYTRIPFACSWRIKLSGAAAADRVFAVGGVVL